MSVLSDILIIVRVMKMVLYCLIIEASVALSQGDNRYNYLQLKDQTQVLVLLRYKTAAVFVLILVLKEKLVV